MYNIITISREFGSGGRTIGRRLAEKLGYKFYDSEIVSKVAEESGYHEDFIEKHGEYATSGNSVLFSLSRSGSVAGNPSIYDDIYLAQQKVILEIAKEGNVVIVGRCADYILRNFDNVLNIFIFSNFESRAQRVIHEYGERNDKSIEKRLKDRDQKRKLYYKTYTGEEWGKTQNYDLSLNSSTFGIDKCVDLIYKVVKESK